MSKKIVLALVAVVVLALGGVVLYVQVLRDDAPAELDFTDQGEAPGTTDGGDDAPPLAVDGEWVATGESVVGYRVIEDFVGGLQNAEAVGRTSEVEGSLTIAGAEVDGVTFTADLTTLESDDARRDGQVQGRLLETATFPTATFTATAPIDLGAVPDDGVEITATATGELDLHGVVREVTFDVRAKRTGARIEVVGQIPVVFADYDIENPTNPFVSTRDEGVLEVLLVLEPA